MSICSLQPRAVVHSVPNFSVNRQTKVIVLNDERIQRLEFFFFFFFARKEQQVGCMMMISLT